VLFVSTSVFPRRRAERFAQRLEEAGGGRRHHARTRAEDDLAELVGIGHRLSGIELTVEADPEFRTGLRAMLMATVEREGIGATALDPDPTMVITTPARHRRIEPRQVAASLRTRPARTEHAWLAQLKTRRARGLVAATLATTAVAAWGMSAASGSAIPGDTLYSVKRSSEHAQLALAGSEISKAQLYLEFAKTRRNESAAVHGDPVGLGALLADMDEETRQGVRLLTSAAVNRHDPAALDVVDAFVAEQKRALGALAAGQSPAERARTESSLALLDDVAKRSAALRGTLSCGNLAEAVTDALGPRPGHCVAQPANGANPGAGPNGTAGQPGGAGAKGNPSTGPGATDLPVEVGSPSAPSSPSPAPSDQSGGGLLGDLGHLIGGLFD
jgi:Domain of unknown function (DUF5667)